MGKKIFIDLRVSGDVLPGVDQFDTYTPPEGSIVAVKRFWGSAAGLPNAAVALAWDYGESGEELISSIKEMGEAPTNAVRVIESSETDNVKKIGLYLTNGEAGSLLLSGYVRLAVMLP